VTNADLAPLGVPCSYCGARASQACFNRGENVVMTGYHNARWAETAAKPVIADPYRTPEPPSFTLQIDETTTLGQLQVVFAAHGIDLRLWFKGGRYLCKVFAQPPSVEASGDGSGETMAQAIREAVLQLRSRMAVKMIGEGVVR
jgi:hypothetical protein